MRKEYTSPVLFYFESGEHLANLTIAYDTFGELNSKKNNIVWVFHALTANSDVSEWWPTLFGNDKILNPDRYFIICANVIGSPYGSSCPEDLRFPKFTVRDVCKAHLLLADYLEIKDIVFCIGASFGGDQALEFAYSFNGKIRHLALIASCAKESAWAIAVHETQRLALASDPTFGRLGGGQEGLKAARAIGMLTYRTSKIFIDRQTDKDEKMDDFMASSYIQYQGEKFANRFNALSYYYLTKCLDSHDVGRHRGGLTTALSRISIPTMIIGIDSDILIPTTLQKQMQQLLPQASYKEITSDAGHDGFLIEGEKINKLLHPFLYENRVEYAVHKFGGKSLANGKPIAQVTEIIKKINALEPIVIVASARGNTTDQLLKLYRKAHEGLVYQQELNDLILYQKNGTDIDLNDLSEELEQVLQATSILGIRQPRIEQKIVAFGELFSVRMLCHLLQQENLLVTAVDARCYIKTIEINGQMEVDIKSSRINTCNLIKQLSAQTIPVITGYISSDEDGQTTNLGRNGSNYSASLIANFINANGIYNWTDVNGVYSANPKVVPSAKLIKHLSYREANDLANFGTNLLHTKTILPLIKTAIPLYIKNSMNPDQSGTQIDETGSQKGIKAVSVIDQVSLISVEGDRLLGKVGIDSRIFTCLSRNHISVRLISQASSERGIGFVVDSNDAKLATVALTEEFNLEFGQRVISSIQANNNICIIAITGRHNYALEKAIQGLRQQKIWIHLFSNSISGENISLVIDKSKMVSAVNIVHGFVV